MIYIKNEKQIAGVRESCRMLRDAFQAVIPMVHPGMTTKEVDKLFYKEICALGGKPAFLGYYDFPATACISLNDEVIHGIPGNKVIGPSDIVSIDCGVNYEGYISDAARSILMPEASQEARDLVRVTEECLDRAIALVKPGVRIREIARSVYAHATEHGYGVVEDYTGHGVGLELHEDPFIPNVPRGGGLGTRLRAGMIIAIEPMINMGKKGVHTLADDWTVVTNDHSLSAHFEHTMLVTEDGVDVLSEGR